MSKNLSKRQKRERKVKKRAERKRNWNDKCIEKLVEGARILNKEKDLKNE